jgi:hypothetical protein
MIKTYVRSTNQCMPTLPAMALEISSFDSYPGYKVAEQYEVTATLGISFYAVDGHREKALELARKRLSIFLFQEFFNDLDDLRSSVYAGDAGSLLDKISEMQNKMENYVS